MSIPLFENDKIKIFFGVDNRTAPYTEDDVIQLQLIANDLTKIYRQRKADYTIPESEKKYRSLFENILDYFAFCKMKFNEQNKPIDVVYLEINEAFERITGLKKEQLLGKSYRDSTTLLQKDKCGEAGLRR